MSSSWLRRPVLLFAFLSLALGLLAELPSPWHAWLRDGCEVVNCYCEPLRDRWVTQMAATYSNLGFLLVGGLMWAAPRTPGVTSLIHTQPLYARLLSLTALAVGGSSFFYHASLTRLGEWLDLVSLYGFTSFLVLYGWARLFPASPLWLLSMGYVGLNLAGGVQMLVAREWQQVVFGAYAGSAILIEFVVWYWRRPRIARHYFGVALACFALGALLWVWPCAPTLFPPHAVWHLLAASSMGWVFLYYRTEQPLAL